MVKRIVTWRMVIWTLWGACMVLVATLPDPWGVALALGWLMVGGIMLGFFTHD